MRYRGGCQTYANVCEKDANCARGQAGHLDDEHQAEPHAEIELVDTRLISVARRGHRAALVQPGRGRRDVQRLVLSKHGHVKRIGPDVARGVIRLSLDNRRR